MSPVITNPYLLAVETQVALLKLSALQVLKGANVRVTEMFKSHRMAFPQTPTLPPRRITRKGEEKFFASESTECMKLSMIPWCLHWNCHVGGVRVMDGHPTASNAVVLQVTWNSTLRHTDMQSENILFLRLCTLLSWDYLNNSYTDGTPSGESAYVYTYINLCMHFEFVNIIRPTGCCRFEAWSGKNLTLTLWSCLHQPIWWMDPLPQDFRFQTYWCDPMWSLIEA